MLRVRINIAENSAKYKKDEIGSLSVVLAEDNGEVFIALKDDGEGIEASLTGKIFDSFYRNDPARTNPVKGKWPRAFDRKTNHYESWREDLGGKQCRRRLDDLYQPSCDEKIIDERDEDQHAEKR